MLGWVLLRTSQTQTCTYVAAVESPPKMPETDACSGLEAWREDSLNPRSNCSGRLRVDNSCSEHAHLKPQAMHPRS